MVQGVEEVIKGILADLELTYSQRLTALAGAAKNTLDPVPLSREAQRLADRNIVLDMGEGNAPYRPRYVLPDYDKFIRQENRFLMLDPLGDIWDAMSDLLILYRRVSSVIAGSVRIGHVDKLLDPFVKNEEEVRHVTRISLTHVNRTISNSFCHADIGPYDIKAGRIILELPAQMQRPVPNMSLIYNKHTTDEFACKAIETGLVMVKPSSVNDAMYTADWGREYVIVSCYSALSIGGGGLTLGWLNMKKLGDVTESREHFLDHLLPAVVTAQCEQMDKRDTYILEQGRFLENTFLCSEGLIRRDKSVGMFGMVGLAECVNTVLKLEKPEEQYGHDREVQEFALLILGRMHEQIKVYKPKYGRFETHGQVGIATDTGVTPNIRIPVGEEPPLHDQLLLTVLTQKHLAAGTGELFPFEETAKKNPMAVLDIIKGAFGGGMRYFSFYSSSSDVVRVIGYLIKRSDIERFNAGEACLGNSTTLGSKASRGLHIFERSARQVPQERD